MEEKKICTKITEWVYITPNGDVRCCPWNAIVIGNLLENTLEEIWNGSKMKEIRKSFLEGDLIGCYQACCPECINESCFVTATKEEAEKLYDKIEDLPPILNISYDYRCNHKCPTCRHEFLKCDDEYVNRMKKITDNIEPYLGKVRRFSCNGLGDFFASHEMLDMISRFRPSNDDFSLFLETNGVLFKKNWHKIEWVKDYNFTVSVTPNSFDRETYRYLAGVDDLDNFLESMRFIKQLKDEGAVNHIRMIMVVQDSNFRQIPDFVKRCIEEFGADDVVLRPVFEWFELTREEYLYKNVLNPLHPYHQEYLDILENNPICHDEHVLDWGYQSQQEPQDIFGSDYKFQNYYDCMSNYILCEDKVACLEEFMRCNELQNFSIYGLGNLGKVFVKCIDEGKKYINNIYDKATVQCFEGFCTKEPECQLISNDKSDALIITAINNVAEIYAYLNQCGYKGKIFTLKDIYK